MVRAPKSVDVKLDLKVFSISGTWEPNDAERRAAWELYVELITRTTVAPLDHGLLREALTSTYSMFATARDVLRRYGPDLAEPKPDGRFNLAFLVVAMLNYAVRPVLTYWHPELEAWEAQRPASCSRLDHERAWPHAPELRRAIDSSRAVLVDYARMLSVACGVPDLTAAIPSPGSSAGPR